jgi:hypothetical protein
VALPHSDLKIGEDIWDVGQFLSKPALSVPKGMGRRGLYETIEICVVGFVEAARFFGRAVFGGFIRLRMVEI